MVQFTILDFWLQAPFTLLKRYPTLEQLPLKDLQIKDLTKISTRTLSSNDTRKTRIEWCTKDMQVLEQSCIQNTSKAQIYSINVWEC